MEGHIKINSIQDIFDNCTEENVDRFLKDFKSVILNYKELHPEFKKQKISIYDNGFYWKDDGIHEVTRTDIKLNDIEISIKKS